MNIKVYFHRDSKVKQLKWESKAEASRLRSEEETNKTQTLFNFIFMFLPLLPAECCDFYLTLHHLARVFVVFSGLTRKLRWSGCFHWLSEKDYLVSAYSGTIIKQGIDCWKTGQQQTHQSLECHFLFTVGLTVLYRDGTNNNDAFWRHNPFN